MPLGITLFSENGNDSAAVGGVDEVLDFLGLAGGDQRLDGVGVLVALFYADQVGVVLGGVAGGVLNGQSVGGRIQAGVQRVVAVDDGQIHVFAGQRQLSGLHFHELHVLGVVHDVVLGGLNAHAVPFDSSKTARQITRSDYARFDLIICMDSMNLRWLRYIIPDDPENKVHLMMSFAGSNRDVADPWYTGDFETTYNDILTASEQLLKKFSTKKFY